jgi:starch phosphorylase
LQQEFWRSPTPPSTNSLRLTIGTERRQSAKKSRADNFFLFGLRAHEVSSLKAQAYRPMGRWRRFRAARSHCRPILRVPRHDVISSARRYLLLSDRTWCSPIAACQERLPEAYWDVQYWTRMSILNAARCGKFSSEGTPPPILP